MSKPNGWNSLSKQLESINAELATLPDESSWTKPAQLAPFPVIPGQLGPLPEVHIPEERIIENVKQQIIVIEDHIFKPTLVKSKSVIVIDNSLFTRLIEAKQFMDYQYSTVDRDTYDTKLEKLYLTQGLFNMMDYYYRLIIKHNDYTLKGSVNYSNIKLEALPYKIEYTTQLISPQARQSYFIGVTQELDKLRKYLYENLVTIGKLTNRLVVPELAPSKFGGKMHTRKQKKHNQRNYKKHRKSTRKH